MSIVDALRNVVAPLAGAAGDAVLGYGVDKRAAIEQEMKRQAADQQAKRDAVTATLAAKQGAHLDAQSFAAMHPQPHMQIVSTDQGIARVPQQGDAGIIKGPDGKPLAKPPTEDRALLPVQQADGSVTYVPRAQAAGQHAPSPNSTGGAAIQKAVANNRMQLQVIDDALKELDAHPSAVGLARAAGDIPLVGGAIGDPINQHTDPAGVAARASIANIGSLKVHDRSGGAVTLSEYPRLAPFIPKISDTPEAIRTKLGKIRAGIETENAALLGPRGNGGATPTSGAAPKHDVSHILTKYNLEP